MLDFAIPVAHRVKLKESEKNDKCIDLAKELKKTVRHESGGYTNFNRCSSWYNHQMICKMNRGLRNKRKSGNNPNDNIAEIGQNTEKSAGALRRVVVTQTPVKDHKVTMM